MRHYFASCLLAALLLAVMPASGFADGDWTPPVDLTPYATDTDLTDHNASDTAHSETQSVYFDAGGFSVDGAQCTVTTEVTVNSGPDQFAAVCADSDSSTIYGNMVMPDGWDAGTVTFELNYLQTAADTNVLNSDIACACRGAGEAVNNTWGTEIAIDDAALTGSNAVDQTTSAAVTCNGTCAAGDSLYWRWQMDAAGTTTAVATLYILGVKMEYTGAIGN